MMGCEHEGTVVGRRGRDHERHAQACAAALGKGKTAILDRAVEVTDWNRDRTRQQFLAQLKQPPGRAVTTAAMIDQCEAQGCECSYDAQPVLQKFGPFRVAVADGALQRR